MQEETYPFVMRQLPYEVYALSPCISAECILYHHDRIYKKYVDLLNQDLADYSNLQKKSMVELLSEIENLPAALQESVRLHGGAAYAHELYFDSMLPLVYEQDPKGTLQEAIIHDFGSVRDLRDCIKNAAQMISGVGYVWLTLGMDGMMRITVTPDNEYPPLKKEIPLLVLDVWEHAYYLQYQNRLEEHLNAWSRVVNWRKVARRYEEGMAEVEKKNLLYSGGSVILRLPPENLQGDAWKDRKQQDLQEATGEELNSPDLQEGIQKDWESDGLQEEWNSEDPQQESQTEWDSEFSYVP